jgi:hypothetical protein
LRGRHVDNLGGSSETLVHQQDVFHSDQEDVVVRGVCVDSQALYFVEEE